MKKLLYSLGFFFISFMIYFNKISLKIFNYELIYYTLFLATFFLVIYIITKTKKGEKDAFDKIVKRKTKDFKLFLLSIFILLILIYYFDNSLFLKIVNSNNITSNIFNFINNNIINKTYFGVLSLFFIGSIFFFYVPLEISFLYFKDALNPYLLFLVVITSILLGFSLNFLLGKIFTRKITNNEKYQNFFKFIEKFGGPLIMIALFTPLPSQLLTFISGGAKLSYKKLIFFSLIGIIVKYLLLFFYGNTIINYITNFF